MMRSAGPSLAMAVAAITLLAPGCAQDAAGPQEAGKGAPTRANFRLLKEDNERLGARVADLARQVESLQALGEKRLDKLYHVQRIELGRHTGGIDPDGEGGDDGIKVYLKPIDQHGSVIKAAGQVRIRLFDLAADPGGNLVAEGNWSVEEVSQHWHGGFGAYHFSFECPWSAGPPANDQITVQVQFTDYLTGEVFSAQKLCKVKLPAG